MMMNNDDIKTTTMKKNGDDNGLIVEPLISVKFGGFLSNLHSINAGVPQGSIMSAIPFILFMKDLVFSTSSSIHSFADHTFQVLLFHLIHINIPTTTLHSIQAPESPFSSKI